MEWEGSFLSMEIEGTPYETWTHSRFRWTPPQKVIGQVLELSAKSGLTSTSKAIPKNRRAERDEQYFLQSSMFPGTVCRGIKCVSLLRRLSFIGGGNVSKRYAGRIRKTIIREIPTLRPGEKNKLVDFFGGRDTPPHLWHCMLLLLLILFSVFIYVIAWIVRAKTAWICRNLREIPMPMLPPQCRRRKRERQRALLFRIENPGMIWEIQYE